MREAFYRAVESLLDEDPRTALILADISAAPLIGVLRRHPDRAINVGIREQLMISVAGGMALTGLRPIAHSYAPFLIERAWEQVKLDLTHQQVGAILVSVGASYDASTSGRTHHGPGDVALLDTLEGWTIRVPGHPDEVGPMLREAVGHDNPVYIRLAEDHNDHQTRRMAVSLRSTMDIEPW
jgi:transketolase